MKIYFETYGCSANIAESEIMAGILKSKGHEIVDSAENANAIIVNTCLVKSTTEQKIFFRLNEIQEEYPDKKLIVAGCMPEGAYDRVKAVVPNASMISTHQIKKITQVVEKKERVDVLGESNDIKLCLPKVRTNPVIDIVPISSGCNGACTYCAVRIAKGKLFSFPQKMILDQIKSAVNEGCKEIWITSQDTAAYGTEKGAKSQLPELLNNISKIEGDFIVRIGMMNPNHIKNIMPQLIEAFNNKKIYKFFHIPIQSGDNEMLKTMNRFYSTYEFEEIIESLRDAFKCQIWTDIIVGYPGETEEQFRNSMNLIKKLKLDFANISRFGSRPDTPAGKLKQLPTDEMKRRTKLATDLVINLSMEKNREWVGWEGEILITEPGKKPGQWIGRNFAYKKIIINKSGNLLGKKVIVKINDAILTGLLGRISK